MTPGDPDGRGGLTVEPPTGVINVIDGEAGSIPRADVAQFCLDAVLVEVSYLGETSFMQQQHPTFISNSSSLAPLPPPPRTSLTLARPPASPPPAELAGSRTGAARQGEWRLKVIA